MNERERQLHVGPGPCGQSPPPPANGSAPRAAAPTSILVVLSPSKGSDGSAHGTDRGWPLTPVVSRAGRHYRIGLRGPRCVRAWLSGENKREEENREPSRGPVRSKKSVEPGTFQRKRRLKGVGEAALVGSEEEEQEKEEKRGWREHLVPAGRAGPGSAGHTGAWAAALPGPGTPPAGAPGLRSEAPPGSCCPLPPRRDGTVPAPARCPRGRSETRTGTLSLRSPPGRAPPAPPGQPLPGRTPPPGVSRLGTHRLPDHATPREKGPHGVGCSRVGAALIPPEGAMASVSPAHPRAGATSGP
ncbi:collagen alpha-1(III) chain-like [Catharus ustulatus]|uniref:collagen alpha-1(III) chain-like n=1 Tax=Catharus ustulatus TaxID=91951 RepID=UPI0014089CB2|nr:collagen alpha-1(III) chain-like [Catharus ustulatus]